MAEFPRILVAVVGAGPAGFYATERLAAEGFGVALFNRDIKPGGMVEYGIFPDKHSLKDGLRKQFSRILSSDLVHYYGNVSASITGCLSLTEFSEWGIPAVLVTIGAQGTKWLGLPGENLQGVYHAKDIVYHYNKRPPFSTMDIHIGKRVAIVGVGNVMTDVAHYLIKYRQVEDVFVIARRGPAEVKFEKKELLPLVHYLDLQDLDQEFERVTPVMTALGQEPDLEKDFILSAMEKGYPRENTANIRMRFMYSPREIVSDLNGGVAGLVLEENTLVSEGVNIIAKGQGKLSMLDVDTIIFAIGDKVDESIGLPLQQNGYSVSSHPLYPVEGVSYEVTEEKTDRPYKGVFVAGWSRKPSSGLVGNAKKDGINAAVAIMSYLVANSTETSLKMDALDKIVGGLGCTAIQKFDLLRLEEDERKQALLLGLPEYKYSTNKEMLKVMGLNYVV